MRNVLLIEPNYKNKYPPLGLMKISAYHKLLGDNVVFYKGLNNDLKNRKWDRIYITTLFTFYYSLTIKTILYYKRCVNNTNDFFVGGIAASLIPNKFEEDTGLKVTKGLLDRPGILDNNDIIIDQLVPDYSILDEIEYKYPAGNAYFAYTTRGCIRKCDFCAVPELEPIYKNYVSIYNQIQEINNLYGEKPHLLLLDNNVLASNQFKDIIKEIKSLGFEKDSYFTPYNELEFLLRKIRESNYDLRLIEKAKELVYKLRRRIARYASLEKQFYNILEKYKIELDDKSYNKKNMTLAFEELLPMYEKHRNKTKMQRTVDFNQGIDLRLLDEDKIIMLSEICIKPLRIAFDHIELKDEYINKIKLAAKYGIKDFSNYILYNYKDKPEDLYNRLLINTQLATELNCEIYSFPMKYTPIQRTDRTYIGKYWNKKYISSIHKILNVTKGVVARGEIFFRKAFGNDLNEYFKILLMPDEYIVYRFKHEGDGSTDEWWKCLNSLPNEKLEFTLDYIKNSDTLNKPQGFTLDNDILNVIKHYITKR